MAQKGNSFRSLMAGLFPHRFARRRSGASAVGLGGFLLSCWLCSAAVRAEPPTTLPEYQLKAVFLFNFVKFVDWPATSFGSPQAPLVIGLWGRNPFGPMLQEVIEGKTISGHPLQLRQVKQSQELRAVHLLFVPSGTVDKVEEHKPLLGHSALLTVGEQPVFEQAGGIITFFSEDNKLRFSINQKKATEAKLTISSKLLHLAARVEKAEPYVP